MDRQERQAVDLTRQFGRVGFDRALAEMIGDSDATQAANEVVAKTLQEPGCIAYNCLRDAADGSKFVFIEEWADRDALKEHFGTEHLRQFGEKAAHAFLQNPEIVMHTVEKSQTL